MTTCHFADDVGDHALSESVKGVVDLWTVGREGEREVEEEKEEKKDKSF